MEGEFFRSVTVYNVLEKFYKEKFEVYDKILHSLLKMHQSYPIELADWLKEQICEFHIEFIYEKYKDDLNELLDLDLSDEAKKSCFKYYANDFKKILQEELFSK